MANEDLKELINLINSSPSGYRLKIKVSANSKKDSCEILKDDPNANFLKIKISKPAVDGKANKAITDYLSELLDIPKSNIKIITGEKSSQKCLLIKPKMI